MDLCSDGAQCRWPQGRAGRWCVDSGKYRNEVARQLSPRRSSPATPCNTDAFKGALQLHPSLQRICTDRVRMPNHPGQPDVPPRVLFHLPSQAHEDHCPSLPLSSPRAVRHDGPSESLYGSTADLHFNQSRRPISPDRARMFLTSPADAPPTFPAELAAPCFGFSVTRPMNSRRSRIEEGEGCGPCGRAKAAVCATWPAILGRLDVWRRTRSCGMHAC